MNEVLKPCPKCGECSIELELWEMGDNNGTAYRYRCTNLDAWDAWFDTLEEAKEDWNKRVVPATHAADIETVRDGFEEWWCKTVADGQWTALERLAAKDAWNATLAALDRLEGRS